MSVDVDVDVDTRAAVVASCKVNDVGHTTTSVATTVDDDDDEFAVVVASSSIGQVVKNDEVFVRRDLDHGVTFPLPLQAIPLLLLLLMMLMLLLFSPEKSTIEEAYHHSIAVGRDALEQGKGGGGSTSIVVVDSSVGGVAIPLFVGVATRFVHGEANNGDFSSNVIPLLLLSYLYCRDGQENGIIWVERLLFFLLDVDSSASFRYLFPRRDRL
eukprot:CAMPEP_0171007816 /NCGR_PEP_ID=MMETSP0736-20130129/20081_1 /TAXON_ID=186038 /ORGANISM="Fragilariopsis kerguelensis, Strain L26-C5" /LENGTH=212 /DNA_ID=CAMNT_0011438571 /DNA_START=716 /DNA_END=1352 /DNA_ORIENTATION=+